MRALLALHTASPAPLMSSMFCVIMTRLPISAGAGRSLGTKSHCVVLKNCGGSASSTGALD